MRAYMKNDPEKIVSMASCIFEDDEDSFEDSVEDLFSSDHDFFEEEVGDKYKLSYRIEDVDELSSKKLKKVKEPFELYYSNFDSDDISAIIIIEIEITAKEGKSSEDITRYIALSKEKGGWKILSASAYSLF